MSEYTNINFISFIFYFKGSISKLKSINFKVGEPIQNGSWCIAPFLTVDVTQQIFRLSDIYEFNWKEENHLSNI